MMDDEHKDDDLVDEKVPSVTDSETNDLLGPPSTDPGSTHVSLGGRNITVNNRVFPYL